MRLPKDRPSIFKYESYRLYIKEMCAYLQKTRKELSSFRAVSVHLGFRSQSYLKFVIDGERALSKKSLDKLISGFALGKREARYFANLVGFEQAKSIEEKTYFSHELLRSKIRSDARDIDRSQLKYLTELHYITIREMVGLKGFDSDVPRIARALAPRLTLKQVESAIEDLVEMGYLRRDESGRLESDSHAISTGDTKLWDKMQRAALRALHKSMAELALNSLENFPPEERNISGVTVALTKDSFQRAEEIMAKTRRELLALEAEQQKSAADEVYRINLQLFPLTQWKKTGGDK